MKKINESKFELMKVAEIREFLHNFDEAVEACEFLTTAMPAQKAAWRAAYLNMVAAYESSYKAEESDEIRTLDFQRDNWITAIKAAANGASKSFDTEMKAAGEAVMQVFTSFPVKLNDNYIAESAQVDTLLAVLLDQNLENVTKIGALALVNLVKETNERLHVLVADRDLEYPNRPDRPGARQAAIDAYLAFTEYINSYRLVIVGSDENPEFDLFIELVNSIIARFERVVLREKPTPKPEEEDEEKEEEEESEQTEEEEEGDEHEGMFKIDYVFDGEIVATQWYHEGETIVEPEGLLPSGWIWGNTPGVMPARDIIVTAVEED